MRKPTTIDIARLAGVSQSTVSFVLNNKDVSISEETKKKVLEAAAALDYTFRRNSKTKQKIIGLMIPTISNPYYHVLTQALEAYLGTQGYKAIICDTSRSADDEEYYLNTLPDRGVSGIIFEFTPSNQDLVNKLSETLPIVLIGEKNDNLNIDTISLNSYKAGELIAQHLIDLGHKKIAYLSGPLLNTSLSRKKRLDGIISKLKEYKLDKSFVVEVASNEYESYESIYEIEIGKELTKKILKEHNVTAIIGVNDMTALGIMNILNSMGLKVPQDISVCGFDNIFLSKLLVPSITTIDHCSEHRSKLAVDILIDKINKNHNRVLKIEYEPQLIIRESTGFIL